MTVDELYYKNQPRIGGLTGRIALMARHRMFESVMALARPAASTLVLDVGVTTEDQHVESNFFEKLYPHKSSLTALGLGDGAALEKAYPGLCYVQGDGLEMPFDDLSFDLVVSFAVVEHLGGRERQRAFIAELCRVGKTVCVTTPNRWYPVEFHTAVPLLHWLPPKQFRKILAAFGKSFYAEESNLNLLDAAALRSFFPNGMLVERHYRLLGIVSNLLFFWRAAGLHAEK